jgi:acyl-coenzyme A synthetase/AMP-(fatty) acid ligase/aryl carrier-like protein
MGDSLETVANFPPEQRAIRDKCFHPTGTFIEFKQEEIDQSISKRFEQQVARYAARIAVRSKRHTFTYDELNRAANRAARAILDQSDIVQQPIAVLFEHGAPFVIASLGVLKTGNVQVSLESGFPQARLRYMLEQSNAAILVTDNANLPLAQQLGDIPLVNIDEIGDRFTDENLDMSVRPDDRAAIAFTSGSTGTPKGIVWNQRGVLHAVMRHTNMFQICADDRMVMFRASLRPCLYALLNGATYYPVALRDEAVLALAEWLTQEKITIYRSAVSAFRSFAGTLTACESFPYLRLILLFGEQMYHVDVELYRRHFAKASILASSLGCLEFDDYAYYFVDRNVPRRGDVVPGGYPIADAEILLLDDGRRPVGPDQIGEIAISSRYNPVGHWQKPNLTAVALLRRAGREDQTTYLTGDLGRRSSDGCLFHQGRKDFQVKIRGHRVDLTEIEAALLEIDGIKAAVAAGWEDEPGNKRVVAYIVPTAAQLPPVTELRRVLGDKLPDYMLPSAFIKLDAVPLTATGKIDRRALPSPGRARPLLKSPFVAPRTPLEEKLAQLWAQMLGLDEVGVHDGFLDLGGDSLLATQVVSRVLTQFHARVSLRALFDAPTVAEMAALLAESDTDENRYRIVAELKTLGRRRSVPKKALGRL